jgi:hypothetical protein
VAGRSSSLPTGPGNLCQTPFGSVHNATARIFPLAGTVRHYWNLQSCKLEDRVLESGGVRGHVRSRSCGAGPSGATSITATQYVLRSSAT